MKRRNGHRLRWAEWLLLPVAACLVSILLSLRGKTFRPDVLQNRWNALNPLGVRESGFRTGDGICSTNLKQIGLAFIQYTQDYDDKLPPVATAGRYYGWADAIQPYLKSVQIYHCPVAPLASPNSAFGPALPGYTDYWFNGHLNTARLSSIRRPTQTFLAGEGNDGRDVADARYSRMALSPSWLTTPGSPARRHLEYRVWADWIGIYLFADGHVKGIPPESIAAHSGGYTFWPR